MIAPAANLLAVPRRQLDGLFRRSDAGPIPNGTAEGTALIGTGTPIGPVLAAFVRIVAWKGKRFDRARGRLVNRVTPFDIDAVVANVYEGPSLMDGRPCIVLDYSKTSFIAHFIRDELRLIGPNLYLGRAYWSGIPLIGFSLQFP